jgi:hypothetical protein
MKKLYLTIFCIGLFWSCQVEEDTQVINSSNGLDAESALTGLLKRSTQNPTTLDNFIDGSSKIKVEFPANLIINNDVNFSLESSEDYFSLIQILESTPAKDTIAFNYPVTVSKIDYTEVTVNSDAELEEVLSDTDESSEINCLDLNYPLGVRFFDASNSFIDTQAISSEAQFFNFLNMVNRNSLFYELEFPVILTLDNEFETIVNSNAVLTSLFEELAESCFDPLLYDNTGSDTNPTDLEMFVMFISDGNFVVNEFIDEGEVIDQYANSNFNFSIGEGFEGSIFDNQEFVGDWSASFDDGVIVFELNFNTSFYGELDEDWDVVSYDETNLNLIDISSDGDSSSLVLSKMN